MRRAALAFAAVVAAVPASAGTTVGEVVANTIYQTNTRHGEVMTDAKMSATVAAANSAAATLRSAGGGDNWMAIALASAFPAGSSVTTGEARWNDGRFTAAGLTAWNDSNQPSCNDYTFNVDAQGNLIVPSIRLQGGAPMSAGQWVARMSPGWPDGNSIVRYASQGQSLALWYAHKANQGNVDKRYWLGVWRVYASGGRLYYDMSSQAYYDTQGSLVARRVNVDQVGPIENYTYVGGLSEFNQPCPQGQAGGTTHYYVTAANQCTAYTPNATLGSGGYAYPETATVPSGTWRQSTWTAPDSLMACDANAEFLRRLVDAVYLKATQGSGYSGYQYHPVQTADLRSGGSQPKVKDLIAPATVPTSYSAGTANPAPISTPAPTPTATASSPAIDTTHPDVSAPNVDSAPDFKFWPDNLSGLVPSVDMSNYTGGSCPTYSGSVFSHQVVLDAHCPFVQNNRALISSIMVFFWGILAAFVILRA